MHSLRGKAWTVLAALVICLMTSCGTSSELSDGPKPATFPVPGVVLLSGGPPVDANDSATRPVANAQVDVKQGESIITTVFTDDEGRYSTSLRAGSYTFNARTGASGYCGDAVSVDVKDDTSHAVDIVCHVD